MAGSTFRDFMRDVEAEARAEGSEAVEELETFREYFRLAREIALARKAKGWSQQELADRCKVHQSDISKIERAQGNPTFWTLQTIARQLNRSFRIGARRGPRRALAASPRPNRLTRAKARRRGRAR
jgi:transcriptional regulator with XRE-family HTH domain